MIRIELFPVVKVGRFVLLWCAVSVNDYGDLQYGALGLTMRHARDRCLHFARTHE